MKGSSIKQKYIEGVGKRLGDLVDEGLETESIQMREREKEVLARQRLNDTIQIKRLVYVLKGSDGLDPFYGDNSSHDGHQAKPALILGKHLYR